VQIRECEWRVRCQIINTATCTLVLEASPPMQLLSMFTENSLEQTHESIALADDCIPLHQAITAHGVVVRAPEHF
jgi:hypothetical protein